MNATLHSSDVRFTHDIYHPEALTEAITQYRDHLTVVIVHRTSDETRVRFSATGDAQPEEALIREFLNYALDLSARAKLGAA